MIPAMKFKTYGKDAKHFSLDKEYLVSIKYDGNLKKIVQEGKDTRWFTSNDKEFQLPIKMPEGKYIAFAEFMYGCEGKLGDRVHSAILTTLRTNFAKGLNSTIDTNLCNIKVFDIYIENEPFTYRYKELKQLFLDKAVSAIKLKGQQALQYTKLLVNQGWEGSILREPEGLFLPGKRVHHVIKVKYKPTADLLCIDVEEGKGKCNGIGALVLQDSKGRIVKVGSGLDYSSSTRQGDYIGKVIEIEYEQIIDTYIQPVFKHVREDKTARDID